METKEIHEQKAPKVQIGNRIAVTVNGQSQTWTIVGLGQTDIAEGKIASDAPLASLLLEMQAGEEKPGVIRDRQVVIKVEKILA
ncbi:MAG: GreA/GreB family elongation factor [Candidatus Paceibacterota bacterium]